MATDKTTSLKRLGGGRWQTRDERFTIEPQSGTWVIVDAATTDELGLPLVRGPFGSLTAAKEAIETAREAEPEASPLPERAAALRTRPAATSDSKPTTATRASRSKPREASTSADDGTKEAAWIGALPPDVRRRARRLIDHLTAAGAKDPEGIARRDIGGDVAAAAAFAVSKALEDLGSDATPGAVAALLADGADRDLDVRWRLVDGEGRPITLDRRTLE